VFFGGPRSCNPEVAWLRPTGGLPET